MLSAQPRTSHWRKQEEVERELGLEVQSISTYLQSLCGGTPKNVNYFKTVKELATAGVYRVLGRNTPRRVWWLAFTGKGGAEPRFDAREEVHAFTAEEDGAAPHLIVAPEAAGTTRENAGGASGTTQEGGGRAAGTTARGSVLGTAEDSAIIQERCVPSMS